MCCGALLYRNKKNSLERTLTLTITGLILFVLSNVFPLLTFKLNAEEIHATLLGSVHDLYVQGMLPLAALVLATAVLAPALQLAGLFYVVLPLWLNRTPRHAAPVFKFVAHVTPWAMMEVFMLGILVSLVKLAKMATVIPGIAMFSFAALIIVLAATVASLDPRLVWDRVPVR